MTTQKKYKLKGGNPFSRFFRKKYNSQNTDYQPEIIKEDKVNEGSKINRLSYMSRNGSNVSVQRI